MKKVDKQVSTSNSVMTQLMKCFGFCDVYVRRNRCLNSQQTHAISCRVKIKLSTDNTTNDSIFRTRLNFPLNQIFVGDELSVIRFILHP